MQIAVLKSRGIKMGKLEALPSMVNPLEIGYTQLSTRFDSEYGILWTEMNPKGIPCCTKELLDDLYHHHKDIENCGGQIQVRGELCPVRYSVVASLIPGAFNLGGHLGLFSQLIKNKDRQALLDYSIVCLDVMFSRISHFNLPLVTISLIQGDALGGGLEAALTSDVIIAERNAKIGFPEILFNLIPGHGAFSLVARKIGAADAEKMILSGKIYRAEELHELGLVDVLVEEGQGENAVYEYVRKQSHCSNGYRALKSARNRFNPITYKEMMDITTIWADAALHLDERDLKVMNRFLRSQQKIYGQDTSAKEGKILPWHKLEVDSIAA
jgi:DSF synthase